MQDGFLLEGCNLMITSTSNPRVKQAASLRKSKHRQLLGLTIVDGLRELKCALSAGVDIIEVFVDGTASPLHEREVLLEGFLQNGIEVTTLAKGPFEKIAFGDRNEGVLAVVRFRAKELKELKSNDNRPFFILEGIEKPGNLGAILRSADAAGIAGVILSGHGTDVANPAVIRASLGTVFMVPLVVASTKESINWCCENKKNVFIATPGGERLWCDARLRKNIVFVLGSEAHGVSGEWQDAASIKKIDMQAIRLPMLGVADSLNVAATAAILSFEALRQMQKDSTESMHAHDSSGGSRGS